MSRKICVVVGSRANYSSIKSAMRAIAEHPELELQLVVGASALLDRYGSVLDLIERDGFVADAKVYMLIEGETPSTMAKSTGLGLIELPTVFERLQPDIVLTVGDRFETMATTLAAAYMNIPLAHTMGGEVCGTIDESIRHAVTKFAHIHFPASAGRARADHQAGRARRRRAPRRLPADRSRRRDPAGGGRRPVATACSREGVGEPLDLDQPFLHRLAAPGHDRVRRGRASRSSQTLDGRARARDCRRSCSGRTRTPARRTSRAGIRKLRERGRDDGHALLQEPADRRLHPPAWRGPPCWSATRARRSARARSSARRPSTSAPARPGGERGPERDRRPDTTPVSIADAIERQIEHGRYASEPIYGDGKAGARIADILATVEADGPEAHHVLVPPPCPTWQLDVHGDVRPTRETRAR